MEPTVSPGPSGKVDGDHKIGIRFAGFSAAQAASQ